jgi:putative ABC transport system substrate-binding protein
MRLDSRRLVKFPTGYVRAAELVALSPDAILAQSSPAVVALRRDTNTIPVVFVTVTDPVGRGFVASLAHPGGNITGFSDFDAPMAGKWLADADHAASRARGGPL